MEVLQQLLNTLNSIPSDAWTVIVETAVTAILVSPLTQPIKKWITKEIESPERRSQVSLAIAIIVSLGGGVLDYLHGVPEFAPWFALVQGWLVFATTQPVYRYAVKPLFSKLGGWFAGQVAKATSLSEAKAAAVPAGGLPISGVAPEYSDFSH